MMIWDDRAREKLFKKRVDIFREEVTKLALKELMEHFSGDLSDEELASKAYNIANEMVKKKKYYENDL